MSFVRARSICETRFHIKTLTGNCVITFCGTLSSAGAPLGYPRRILRTQSVHFCGCGLIAGSELPHLYIYFTSSKSIPDEIWRPAEEVLSSSSKQHYLCSLLRGIRLQKTQRTFDEEEPQTSPLLVKLVARARRNLASCRRYATPRSGEGRDSSWRKGDRGRGVRKGESEQRKGGLSKCITKRCKY